MIENIRHKKIAILGMGVEGRSTLNFLLKNGIVPKALLDLKPVPEEDVAATLKDNGIEFVGGQDYLDKLSDYEVLFRTPGIPRLHPKLMAFRDQESILSLTKLFFAICPCPIVGITGTKGKGTTASLIYEIAKAAGRDVYLGGNIGNPPLDFYDKLKPDSLVVFELSSFQLQDLTMSPHIAVVLNITTDHVDVNDPYKASTHGSREEYVMAKAQIILHQKPDDYAVLSAGLPDNFKNMGVGQKIVFDSSQGSGYKTKLLGEHNWQNIAAAVTVAGLLGIKDETVRSAVENFEALPHRLKPVAVKNGITYIDDSFGTNPDSCMAAIAAVKSPTILILGGYDKGLDYTELGKKIIQAPNIKAVVVIGQLKEKILAAIAGFKGQILTGAGNMKEIIAQANSAAEPGDCVLLSTAAASFDMFNDYKDRGNQFIAEVSNL